MGLGGLESHKMFALTSRLGFCMGIKRDGLKGDLGSEHCLMFCGGCAVRKMVAVKKITVGADGGQCGSSFGGVF